MDRFIGSDEMVIDYLIAKFKIQYGQIYSFSFGSGPDNLD